MSFQARGDIHDQSAAGAIVHCAVVRCDRVDGRADADMVDMRGEDDEFVLESGIGTGEFGNDVGDSRALVRMTALALSEIGQGEVRQRLAIFAQGGDFREGVAGTGEELFSGGGVEATPN